MNDQPSIFRRLFERVFPKMPDFFTLLTEQCEHVAHTTGLLVEYMESGDPATGDQIRQDEHEADHIKIRNLHTLNEAFSTPIDREDLYRAIIDLDEIVNYCKSTVSEMTLCTMDRDPIIPFSIPFHLIDFNIRKSQKHIKSALQIV